MTTNAARAFAEGVAICVLSGCSLWLPPLGKTVPRATPAPVPTIERAPRAEPAEVENVARVPRAALEPQGSSARAPLELPNVIYFDPDVYTVKPEYRTLLAQHAKRLKSDPSRRLEVRGHTDATGPLDYNLALSEKRVEMVIKMLVSLGVDERQLQARAYADRRPAAEGGDPASWARNRRVELVYR